MSPKCQDYTEDSAAAAVAWIQANVHANWGGTQIAGTLDAIYDTPVSDGAQPCCIVFLPHDNLTVGWASVCRNFVPSSRLRVPRAHATKSLAYTLVVTHEPVVGAQDTRARYSS